MAGTSLNPVERPYTFPAQIRTRIPMTLISYAQNGEDVVLWRALRHVEKGFYIDIGACDPDELSVTRVFYDLGWSGINVEPSKEFHDRCVARRPRDVNLNLAVTAAPGPVRFLNVPGTGLSTTVESMAEAASARGWTVEERQVRGVTLANICAMADGGDIHFLKIDVEGGEHAVLSGGDFERFRPWIVVVEATIPNSTERSEHEWEPLLLRAGYDRCLFDGLNLYYLARERTELAPRLTAGANVLDDYVPAALAEARQSLEEARRRGAGLETTLARRDALLAAEREALARARAEIGELRQVSARAEAARSDALARLGTFVTTHDELQAERQAHDALRARLERLVRESGQEVPHALGRDSNDLAERLAAHLAWREQEAARLRTALADASGRLEALMGSTSWRVTAPLRQFRHLLGGSQPPRRPAVPAALAANTSPKDLARKVFRRGIRFLLQVPGARRCARLAYRLAPAPVEWLALRYRAYQQHAAKAPPLPTEIRELQSALAPEALAELDMSSEEARLYRQFVTRGLSLSPARQGP
jgi:FkbM family methyltransferase